MHAYSARATIFAKNYETNSESSYNFFSPFSPRPPFNVDVTKNGYIANETSSAINATLKRVGGGRDEYSRGKVVQCVYNVFETTLSHSILSKIVYDI
jgi:hypothetical protein